jgi:hypothetical protein
MFSLAVFCHPKTRRSPWQKSWATSSVYEVEIHGIDYTARFDVNTSYHEFLEGRIPIANKKISKTDPCGGRYERYER